MGLLSLAIWAPIAFGVLLLAIGRDEHARAVRWLALVGAVAQMVSPLLAAVALLATSSFAIVSFHFVCSRWGGCCAHCKCSDDVAIRGTKGLPQLVADLSLYVAH